MPRASAVFATAALAAAFAAAASEACAQTPAGKPVFDGGRAYQHVRQMVSFGPRPAGSPALEQTRRYIVQQLKAAGVAASEQVFEAQTPIGPIRMVNLVATIPGARKERIVLGGHYDTKLFKDFRFVGANDGGSSAAFLIEIARFFKARKNDLTVELVFFDGEEATHPTAWQGTDHTYGSRHYVQNAKKTGTLATLKAMVLVDMIGDRSLQIRRESGSTAWMTDAIWAAARRLGHNTIFVNESMDIEDDHREFLAAGIPAVDIIDLEYDAWHTPDDTVDRVSARSLEIVGAVVMEAWPQIEARAGK
jgi:Zn-dependent M28 family amino/carboxypeptidase